MITRSILILREEIIYGKHTQVSAQVSFPSSFSREKINVLLSLFLLQMNRVIFNRCLKATTFCTCTYLTRIYSDIIFFPCLCEPCKIFTVRDLFLQRVFFRIRSLKFRHANVNLDKVNALTACEKLTTLSTIIISSDLTIEAYFSYSRKTQGPSRSEFKKKMQRYHNPIKHRPRVS